MVARHECNGQQLHCNKRMWNEDQEHRALSRMREESGMRQARKSGAGEDTGAQLGQRKDLWQLENSRVRKPCPPEGQPRLGFGTLWALVDVLKGNQYT